MLGSGGSEKHQQQQQQELQCVRDIYFMVAVDFMLLVKSTIVMDKDILLT